MTFTPEDGHLIVWDDCWRCSECCRLSTGKAELLPAEPVFLPAHRTLALTAHDPGVQEVGNDTPGAES